MLLIGCVVSGGCGDWGSGNRSANESAAITTLHYITVAQEEFRAAGEVDQDGDGKGEYGLLGEIVGMQKMRGSGDLAKRVYLSEKWWDELEGGTVRSKGYLFKVYLPAGEGEGLEEEEGKVPAGVGSEAVDLQEAYYVCYAWPERLGETGTRAFAAIEVAPFWATKMEGRGYEGFEWVPDTGAMYKGEAFVSEPGGSDGNTWSVPTY